MLELVTASPMLLEKIPRRSEDAMLSLTGLVPSLLIWSHTLVPGSRLTSVRIGTPNTGRFARLRESLTLCQAFYCGLRLSHICLFSLSRPTTSDQSDRFFRFFFFS